MEWNMSNGMAFLWNGVKYVLIHMLLNSISSIIKLYNMNFENDFLSSSFNETYIAVMPKS